MIATKHITDSDVVEFFVDTCNVNGIQLPDDDVMAQICIQVKRIHGHVPWLRIKDAFDAWQRGTFHIPRPRPFNLHWVGQVLAMYSEHNSSSYSKKMSGPTKREIDYSDPKVQHELNIKVWQLGFEHHFVGHVQQNQRPSSVFARTLWSCHNIARQYKIKVPETYLPAYYDVVRLADKRTGIESSGAIAAMRRHRQETQQNDIEQWQHEIYEKAATMLTYYDTLVTSGQQLPQLKQQ